MNSSNLPHQITLTTLHTLHNTTHFPLHTPQCTPHSASHDTSQDTILPTLHDTLHTTQEFEASLSELKASPLSGHTAERQLFC